jgi:hypothetical protein
MKIVFCLLAIAGLVLVGCQPKDEPVKAPTTPTTNAPAPAK